MRFALYTKLDLKENNDHIFSVLKSLQKYKIDFDLDSDSFVQLSESLDKNGDEIGVEGSIKIIENNFNNDLKKQLKDVTSEVIKVAGEKNLSDDLTLVGLGN